MATHLRAWVAVAIIMILALTAVLWRPARPALPAGGVRLSRTGESGAAQPVPASAPVPREHPSPAQDLLLTPGLRHTLELLLLEAGEAGDPSALKQRVAQRVGAHFPAALAPHALALAGRYIDYRVALGRLGAPQDPDHPDALRPALQARQATRLQFFDDLEYATLFAREDELDRYALARLQAADPRLDAGQRELALQAAQGLLSAQRRAHYSAVTQHLAAAAQTADFNARNVDSAARHAARSARYGEAAAQALAALDRAEQHWQQRLDQYSQALTEPGRDSAGLVQLRLQLFTAEELARIDAALALRQLAAPG